MDKLEFRVKLGTIPEIRSYYKDPLLISIGIN